jgi:hypothetical protein
MREMSRVEMPHAADAPHIWFLKLSSSHEFSILIGTQIQGLREKERLAAGGMGVCGHEHCGCSGYDKGLHEPVPHLA